MTNVTEFSTHLLAFERNPFHTLQAEVALEELAAGREGAVLVRRSERGTPLVRTTSQYLMAAQNFRAEHEDLATRIEAAASLEGEFNNALIERYSPVYAKMGAHSDQALDLDHESSIAIFSCYRDPKMTPRTLVVQSKENDETFERELLHESVIVFTVAANQRHKHKILLRGAKGADRGPGSDHDWLGITLRRSKTFIQHRGGGGYFESGRPLRFATEDDRELFYRLRGQENRESQFRYPDLDFTLSRGDLP